MLKMFSASVVSAASFCTARWLSPPGFVPSKALINIDTWESFPCPRGV